MVISILPCQVLNAGRELRKGRKMMMPVDAEGFTLQVTTSPPVISTSVL